MERLTIAVELVAKDLLSPSLQTAAKSVAGLGTAVEQSQGVLGRLTSGLGGLGLAAQGLSAITGAVTGVATSFTGPAMEMEAARARINAFTKDSAETEKILAAVRSEADKTPFSFGEMAKAAASLGPTAKRAGVDLTSLLQTAEALSAADPAQGFEGAVMALREAMSGDFMSLRERFEVDTKDMNAAIAAGVSPIEAINAGLEKQGINLDMVKNLASTTAGRMSTFNDSLEGLRRTAGEQILAGFGTQLDNLGAFITDNMDSLQAFARVLGQGIAGAMELAGAAFAAVAPILRTVIGQLAEHLPAASQLMREGIMGAAGVVRDLGQTLLGLYQAAQPVIATVLSDLLPAFQSVAAFIGQNLRPILAAVATFLAAQFVAGVVGAGVALVGFVSTLGTTVAAAGGLVAFLGGPVTLTLAAVGVAAFLLFKAWDTNFLGIQEKTAAVWAFLSTNVFPPLQAVIESFSRVIIPELILTWAALSTTITAVWTAIWTNLLQPGMAALALDWGEKWPAIQLVLTTVWDVIKTTISTIWAAVETIIVAGLKLVRGDWVEAWDTIRDHLKERWDDIKKKTEDIWLPLVTWIGGRLTDLQTAWNEKWTALQTLITGVWDEIKRKSEEVVNGVTGFLATAWDTIKTTAKTAWEGIRDAIIDAFKGITDPVKGVIDGVLALLEPVQKAIAAVMAWKPPAISVPAAQAAATTSAGTNAILGTLRPGGKPGETQAEVDNFNRNQARAGKGGGPEVLGGDAGTQGEGAIGKAMAQIGSQAWNWLCQKFVENMFGTGGRYASAKAAAGALMTNRGGTPARGSLVFFAPDPTNAGFGHVGIALGGDKFVSATANGVKVDSLGDNYWGRLFQGYGPPRFADGVEGFRGGMAIVGERGAELVRLPAGSDVIPHHKTMSALPPMPASRAHTDPTVIEMHLDSRVIGRVMLPHTLAGIDGRVALRVD